jgi:hypothetical protein
MTKEGKIKVTITLDKDILQAGKDTAKDELLNLSAWVNRLIKANTPTKTVGSKQLAVNQQAVSS